MFIVKAESRDGSFTLHQAAKVSVYNHSLDPALNARNDGPEYEIFLKDENGSPLETLEVGSSSAFRLHAVYVMNDRGKTIEVAKERELIGSQSAGPFLFVNGEQVSGK